jgi:hypothetical protein
MTTGEDTIMEPTDTVATLERIEAELAELVEAGQDPDRFIASSLIFLERARWQIMGALAAQQV